MKYYHFRQNNSYGEFTVDKNLNVHVVIKAASAEEANEKLKDLGGYFNGCSNGTDCPCCGDRWSEVSESNAQDFPHIYGSPIEQHPLEINCIIVHE